MLPRPYTLECTQQTLVLVSDIACTHSCSVQLESYRILYRRKFSFSQKFILHDEAVVLVSDIACTLLFCPTIVIPQHLQKSEIIAECTIECLVFQNL